MNRKITALASLLVIAALPLKAQTVDNLSLTREGSYMHLTMDVDLQDTKVPAGRTALLVPQLRDGSNTADFRAIGLYSHNRWYYYDRRRATASGTADEITYRKGRRPDTVHYSAQIPYASWMDGAELVLTRQDVGCCGKPDSATSELLVKQFRDTTPATVRQDTVYVEREVIVEQQSQVLSLSGRAFIDFRLNSSRIDPAYHANTSELAQLRASVDSVRHISGQQIQKIWIKGYASPEGSYKNNAKLAETRTQAVKDYLVSTFGIVPELIETESEPENWEGLRASVEESSLPNRAAILQLIDSDREPDSKEQLIRSRYPDDWQTIQDKILPFLRRTDYRIDYTIQKSAE
ncbi:MAG: OmpA family protein [Bacteroidales bacterium]|nr:OmpA family protein [Bacteroidales bacterium]